MNKTPVEKPIAQDTKFQEREHAFEVIGRWVLGAIVLAALLGLFGDGIFSEKKVAEEATELKYSRFGRVKSETEYDVLVKSKEDPVRITFPNDFLEKIDIVQTIPTPSVEGSLRETHLVFPNPQGEGLMIRIIFEPKVFGSLSSTIVFSNQTHFQVDQFFFP